MKPYHADVRFESEDYEPPHCHFVRRFSNGRLSGFVRHDLVTRSRAQWLEARYHLDRADFALQWQLYSGGPDSVYGQVPQRRTLELSARLYF